MKYLTRIISALALCSVFIALSACNTSKGFGKDMESAGEGIQNSADKNGAN